MDENDRKERFSLAYISAVAAHAGYLVVESRPVDKDSIDGHIEWDEERRPRIEFQAKSTSRGVVRRDELVFPLSVKNYNDLRVPGIVPRILIVVVLPTSDGAWLEHSEEEPRVRHCGYWASLMGQPDTTNRRTVSVRIPRSQVFDTVQLQELMSRANRGEPL